MLPLMNATCNTYSIPIYEDDLSSSHALIKLVEKFYIQTRRKNYCYFLKPELFELWMQQY